MPAISRSTPLDPPHRSRSRYSSIRQDRGDAMGFPKNRPWHRQQHSERQPRKPDVERGDCETTLSVPVASYYEWTGPTGHKKTHLFRHPENEWLQVAGLWEESKEYGLCFSMLTTDASGLVSGIHTGCLPSLTRTTIRVSRQWTRRVCPLQQPPDHRADRESPTQESTHSHSGGIILIPTREAENSASPLLSDKDFWDQRPTSAPWSRR